MTKRTETIPMPAVVEGLAEKNCGVLFGTDKLLPCTDSMLSRLEAIHSKALSYSDHFNGIIELFKAASATPLVARITESALRSAYLMGKSDMAAEIEAAEDELDEDDGPVYPDMSYFCPHCDKDLPDGHTPGDFWDTEKCPHCSAVMPFIFQRYFLPSGYIEIRYPLAAEATGDEDVTSEDEALFVIWKQKECVFAGWIDANSDLQPILYDLSHIDGLADVAEEFDDLFCGDLLSDQEACAQHIPPERDLSLNAYALVPDNGDSTVIEGGKSVVPIYHKRCPACGNDEYLTLIRGDGDGILEYHCACGNTLLWDADREERIEKQQVEPKGWCLVND